jgi:hypothetical protein
MTPLHIPAPLQVDELMDGVVQGPTSSLEPPMASTFVLLSPATVTVGALC